MGEKAGGGLRALTPPRISDDMIFMELKRRRSRRARNAKPSTKAPRSRSGAPASRQQPRPKQREGRVVSATEAARTFSDLLNRVHYRGETFVIERSGKPIGKLAPAAPAHFTVADLSALLEQLPKLDHEYLDILEDITRNQPPVARSPWES